MLAGSRVIVLTATGDQANSRAVLAAGAFDHLAKPVGPQALLRSIRLALRATPTTPK